MAYNWNSNPATIEDIQPHSIFFELNIGGLSQMFKKGYGEGPDFPVEATIDMIAGQSTGNCVITLFDDVGYKVENEVLRLAKSGALKNPITCRWGYTVKGDTSSHSSPTYEVILLKMGASIGRNYFTYTIEGMFNGVVSTLQATNTKPGTIKEIIEDYANTYTDGRVHINPNYDPKKITKPDPTGETTELKEVVLQRQADTTDFAHLQEAVRHLIGTDGKGGYIVYHDKDKSGKILRIERPDVTTKYRVYKVQHELTDVIEWTPELEITLAGVNGKSSDARVGHNQVSGDQVNLVKNPETTKDTKPHPDAWDKEQVNAETTKGSVKVDYQRGNPEINTQKKLLTKSSPDVTSNRASNTRFHNDYQYKNNQLFQATLQVLGDPNLKPNTRVEVIFNYPSSMNEELRNTGGYQGRHYSSGTWLVQGVTHSLSTLGYTSIASLQRIGFK